jgi:hypothetical protein
MKPSHRKTVTLVSGLTIVCLLLRLMLPVLEDALSVSSRQFENCNLQMTEQVLP